jgi:hypothetical protein
LFLKFYFYSKLTLRRLHKTELTGTYKEMLKFDKIEICKVFVEPHTMNPFVIQVMSYWQEYHDKLRSLCTTPGFYAFNNITPSSKQFITIWPRGYYRTHFSFQDPIDDNILKIVQESLVLK